MSQITSYPIGILHLTDYLIGTDQTANGAGATTNVTRSYLVSEVVNTIIASLGIGTVTSISTASSTYINVTGGPITAAGTISASLSATGTSTSNTFLRGDGIWSLPGPAPNTVAILFNGTLLTSTASSMDFTGAGIASAAILNVRVDVPGSTNTVDNAIAGTAISVSAPTGSVTITNDGVILAQAGGNVTLSGGTGNVRVNTTANASSLSLLSAGIGIAPVVNPSTNAIISINTVGGDNYIQASIGATTIDPDDSIEFNQIKTSIVKSVKIGDLSETTLESIKTYVDNADKNVLKNTSDSFKSTQRDTDMVSLTAAEYLVLQNGNTINENTLYFIIGGGVPFTVTHDRTDDINGIGGSAYSLSTSPASFTGVAGTSYNFVTTINEGTGSYSPGNIVSGQLNTPGVIVNNLGTNYTKPFTVTGTWTAPVSPLSRSILQESLEPSDLGTGTGINVSGKDSIWRYNTGKSQPGDSDPTTAQPASVQSTFSFNAEIEIITAAQYQFVDAPKYETSEGSGNFGVGAQTFSGSNSFGANGTTTVTNRSQRIKASFALVEYNYDIIITNNITEVSGIPTSSQYSISFTGTADGDYTYGTTISGTVTATAIGAYKFTTGDPDTRTATFTNFQLIAVSTRTLVLDGTMEDTTPALADMVLAYTDNISGTGGEGVAYTLNPTTAAVTAGTIGAFGVSVGSGYSIIQPTATIISGSGFFFSSGMTATVTPGSNALVANMPAGGGIANQTLTGTIANNTCTYRIEQVAVPVGGAITYQTTFSSSAFTGTFATTNSAIVNKGSQNPGNGNVTVTVNRTSPSTQAQDAGSIQWYLNGALKNSFTIQVGQSVSQSFTVTGVGNGDTVLVIISEG